MSIREGINEWVRNVGADNPTVEYFLSDYDTWEKNPFYTGVPGPHPEDYCGGCGKYDCDGSCQDERYEENPCEGCVVNVDFYCPKGLKRCFPA